MRQVVVILASLALTGTLGGCGPAGAAAPDSDATLQLDGPPAGEDAGIYLAVERGYDEAEGLHLTIEPARDSARADARLMTRQALTRARARGKDLVAVMALVQRRRGPYLVVERTTVEDRPDDVRALIRTLQRGYTEAQVDPQSAVQAIVAREDGVDPARLTAQLDAVSPAFTEGVRYLGELDPRIARGRAFVPGLVGPTSRD